jgi:hypothetical protein
VSRLARIAGPTISVKTHTSSRDSKVWTMLVVSSIRFDSSAVRVGSCTDKSASNLRRNSWSAEGGGTVFVSMAAAVSSAVNRPSRFLRAPPRRLLTKTHSRPFFLHCRGAIKHTQIPNVLSTHLAADRLSTITFGLLGPAAQTRSLHRTPLLPLPLSDSVSVPTAQRLPPACGSMVGAGI